jgi:hypothetical protein
MAGGLVESRDPLKRTIELAHRHTREISSWLSLPLQDFGLSSLPSPCAFIISQGERHLISNLRQRALAEVSGLNLGHAQEKRRKKQGKRSLAG